MHLLESIVPAMNYERCGAIGRGGRGAERFWRLGACRGRESFARGRRHRGRRFRDLLRIRGGGPDAPLRPSPHLPSAAPRPLAARLLLRFVYGDCGDRLAGRCRSRRSGPLNAYRLAGRRGAQW